MKQEKLHCIFPGRRTLPPKHSTDYCDGNVWDVCWFWLYNTSAGELFILVIGCITRTYEIYKASPFLCLMYEVNCQMMLELCSNKFWSIMQTLNQNSDHVDRVKISLFNATLDRVCAKHGDAFSVVFGKMIIIYIK